MRNFLKQTSKISTVMYTTVAVVLLALATLTIYFTFNESRDSSTTETIQLSTFHPTYSSLKDLLSAEDATFVGTAIVLDEGKVRSKTVSGAPKEAPPQVHTDYKLSVQSVIKGDDIPTNITVAIMGGRVNDKRYVYESNIPELKKGDTIILFALKGDDNKYYPLSGSTAIAVQRDDGSFSLDEDTISTGTVIFTEEELIR